ncbi:MAG: NAD-dependent deacetylase [Desulfuromonadales bacterium]|nr:NAD-dependent deacetylase [Desulfuromonadales bacterium]
MQTDLHDRYARIATALAEASTLIVTAGAGMGVDSGLPDFRGSHGFWNAYPMYEQLGISFIGAANPEHFNRDPAFGWGFYGHRTNLYRATDPHHGFALLKDWSQRFNLDTFVVTSNVDGQFQKAGFTEDTILEVHGSIHHLQCTTPCSSNIWPHNEEIPVNTETMRAGHIPACRHCRTTARPNILMFGDYAWISNRTARQEERFDSFLQRNHNRPTVVVELGAGTAIPTIRFLSERLGEHPDVLVVRINPREPSVAPPHISLPVGALAGLKNINIFLDGRIPPQKELEKTS